MLGALALTVPLMLPLVLMAAATDGGPAPTARYEIEGRPVSAEAFAARAAALTHKQGWGCKKTTFGGVTLELGQDPSTGQWYEVRDVFSRTGEGEPSSIRRVAPPAGQSDAGPPPR